MQAVILSAGKGTRMGSYTEQIPKSLISIENKTLLEYKFDALPEEIKEIIIVIGYKGEEIKKYFGDNYKERLIKYIEDTTLTGTAHALWKAKDILEKRFIVMMGDDIYDTKSLKEATSYDFSIVCKCANAEEPGSRVLLDENYQPIEFVTHDKYKTIHEDGGLIFTGLYSLTTDIFNYEPVKMKTKEEWGLPQTLMSMKDDYKIKIIETDFWLSINSPEELSEAQRVLLRQS